MTDPAPERGKAPPGEGVAPAAPGGAASRERSPVPLSREQPSVPLSREQLPIPLSVIAREWGRIGCIGFGGPPAHIALLRKLCVQDRRWLAEQEFEDGIATVNLLPGPASTQLAIYCAWRLRGSVGALIGGACFIVPGLIVILALSVLFLASRPPGPVTALALGAGAAVPAVAVAAAIGLIPASWRRASDLGRGTPQAVKPVDAPKAVETQGAAGTAGAQGAAGTRGAADTEGPVGAPDPPAANDSRTSPDPYTSQNSQRSRSAQATRAVRARWVLYLAAGGAAAALLGPWLVIVLAVCGLTEVAALSRRTRPAAGTAWLAVPAVTVRMLAGAPGHLAPGSAAVTGLRAGGLSALAVVRGLRTGGLSALAATVPAAAGLGAVAWVAFKVGALSYGGGFVIIPLMQHDAVHTYHWMTSAQFLTAVALGQVTPGPVVQTVAVVGYAATGIVGGLLASAVAFAPSFCFVLAGGRYFGRIRRNARVQAFLTGAGPAAIGAIAGAAIPLGLALVHLWQAGVLAVAAGWLIGLRRGVVTGIAGAAVLGVLAYLAGAPVT